MAADVGELCSTVTALRLLIEGVRDGLLEGEPALEGMLGHVRRLGAIVGGLEAPPAGEATCVPPVLRDAAHRVAEPARERRIAPRVDAEAVLPAVACPGEQLPRLLVAPPVGAVARTSPGGEVALRARGRAGGLEVRVDGAEADALVTAIVEIHGGRLWADDGGVGLRLPARGDPLTRPAAG